MGRPRPRGRLRPATPRVRERGWAVRAAALAAVLLVLTVLIVLPGLSARATPPVFGEGAMAVGAPVNAPEAAASPACPPEEPELLWTSLPADARAADLEAMIGQLLLTSFLGKGPADPGAKRAVAAVADGRIGGVLFFRHNVGSRADVLALTEAFRTAHPFLPAFVAVDQEGGAVERLGPAKGVPELPSARTLGRRAPEDARPRFAAVARALADLGFTVNLAPVVDLDVNPNNPVIGRFGRAYGKDPDKVAAFADAFVTAHRSAGVATALKHFPGHGSSAADSHDGVADVTGSWREEELVPFARLVDEGKADMVMAGHLILAGFHEGADAAPPATLSPRLLRDVLRNELCFDGLIVSDDLNMDAISETWPLPEAIVAAIRAGVDVVIASIGGDGDVKEVGAIVGEVRAAAEADPALAAAIRHAYARVVHFKLDRAAGVHRLRSARPSPRLLPVLTETTARD